MSKPTPDDLENLMEAAESPTILNESYQNSKNSGGTPKGGSYQNNLSSEKKSVPNMSEVKTNSSEVPNVREVLNNANISAMLNHFSDNHEEMAKIMQESMGQVTPGMMEQARKLATGNQGQQIIREMQRRGFNPDAMRTQILEQQKAVRLANMQIGNTKRAILITATRKLKIHNVPIDLSSTSVVNIIKSSEPVEISCSRLATGGLAGKTIKVWYDPTIGGKNKRLSKIIGFPASGNGLIVMEEGDLEEKDFLTAEKLLV